MIERDYIMRMINQMVQVLSRVLLHRKAYAFPQARSELQGAYTSLLGMTRDFVRQFSDVQLIGMFGSDEETVAAKCYVLGSLMLEDGELSIFEENEAESVEFFLRSLSLLLSSYLIAGNELESGHAGKIDQLWRRLHQEDIPAHISEKLLSYCEVTGRYAKAEDVLFDLVESDPRYVDGGIRMYERLLVKAEGELEAGGLSRDEILESIQHLRTRERHK